MVRSAAVFQRAVLCFLSDFDFYLLLCKITVLYEAFLFVLSQSNCSHVNSLLSLEGYLQLLSSQMENMLEVNEKTHVLLIDWNTVSDYWIMTYSVLSNKKTPGNISANQCSNLPEDVKDATIHLLQQLSLALPEKFSPVTCLGYETYKVLSFL